jgi:hypothetical protein
MRTRLLSTLETTLAIAAVLGVAGHSDAQQRTRRAQTPRQQTITIKGQVPAPQVVTVRPREVPAVSRQVLVPTYYDRSFWPVILPGYQLVQRSELTGVGATDTAAAPIATAGQSGTPQPAPALLPAPPITQPLPGAQPASTAAAPVQPQTTAGTRDQELEALQREIRMREARLDSLLNRVHREYGPARPDTTRKP